MTEKGQGITPRTQAHQMQEDPARQAWASPKVTDLKIHETQGGPSVGSVENGAYQPS
jgi:hypothetical protein